MLPLAVGVLSKLPEAISCQLSRHCLYFKCRGCVSPQHNEQLVVEQLWQRIQINPEVMLGTPVIPGTRIPVQPIVRMLVQGIPEDQILRECPRLQPDGIRGVPDQA